MILSIMGLVIGYAWIFNNCLTGQITYEREIKRREYIKFQRDSLELELMKKNIK